MHSKLWPLLGGILVAGALVMTYPMWAPQSKVEPNSGLPMKTISIGSHTLEVEIASTEPQRQLGLSGRTSLAYGHGMLFVFDPPKPVGFWMKDMNFSLDMIFADGNGTIQKIDSDVAPGTYPKVFQSGFPTYFVLEVPAGYSAAQGIAVGQKIVVQ
jgi:uncharacterized membrane protein (UPF0127 family)